MRGGRSGREPDVVRAFAIIGVQATRAVDRLDDGGVGEIAREAAPGVERLGRRRPDALAGEVPGQAPLVGRRARRPPGSSRATSPRPARRARRGRQDAACLGGDQDRIIAPPRQPGEDGLFLARADRHGRPVRLVAGEPLVEGRDHLDPAQAPKSAAIARRMARPSAAQEAGKADPASPPPVTHS